MGAPSTAPRSPVAATTSAPSNAGKLADLLVVDGDPSTDIGVLADQPPLAVLKGGEVVAGELPA